MTAVQTVTGPIDSSQLGVTLGHEHVMTRSLGVAEAWPDTFDRAAARRTCIEALKRAKEAGVDTVLDHTTFDIGRDPELLADISAASGVNIVAITGTWVDVPRWFDVPSVERVAELFERDLTEGMSGTSIRAGLVKASLDRAEPAPRAIKVARAAAVAARRANVPISTHTSAPARSGLTMQSILQDAGANLDAVVIGHSGDTTDLSYLRKLLAGAGFVGLDRFGAEQVLDDASRAEVLSQLVEEGFTDQLLLSHDASCFSGWRSNIDPVPGAERWACWHLSERLLPGLIAGRMSEETVRALMVDNPRRLFECAAQGA